MVRSAISDNSSWPMSLLSLCYLCQKWKNIGCEIHKACSGEGIANPRPYFPSLFGLVFLRSSFSLHLCFASCPACRLWAPDCFPLCGLNSSCTWVFSLICTQLLWLSHSFAHSFIIQQSLTTASVFLPCFLCIWEAKTNKISSSCNRKNNLTQD